MAKPKDHKKTIAILTLHDVSLESRKNRRVIATWLYKQADQLVFEGDKYCKKYQAMFYEAK